MTELQRINACAKRPIDVWTNYLYYPLSIRLVYAIRNTRITPNSITLFSLFLALLGCVFYACGDRTSVTVGLVLVQVSYVFDCADGQLARYKQQYSPIGGWLDQTADRIKEFAVYFSLAYGYTRFHPGDTALWKWTVTALFALYLLEYLGQIDFNRPKPGAKPSPQAPSAQPRDTFARLQRIRAFIPFRSFIIGEQYFTMLVFIAFFAIYPFFIFVGVLGLLMVLYRIAISVYKFQRSRASAH